MEAGKVRAAPQPCNSARVRRQVSAGTIAPTSGWSIRASAPPLRSSRGTQVQPHLRLLRILRLANRLWFLLRSRWILKKAAVEEQGGTTS